MGSDRRIRIFDFSLSIPKRSRRGPDGPRVSKMILENSRVSELDRESLRESLGEVERELERELERESLRESLSESLKESLRESMRVVGFREKLIMTEATTNHHGLFLLSSPGPKP